MAPSSAVLARDTGMCQAGFFATSSQACALLSLSFCCPAPQPHDLVPVQYVQENVVLPRASVEYSLEARMTDPQPY